VRIIYFLLNQPFLCDIVLSLVQLSYIRDDIVLSLVQLSYIRDAHVTAWQAVTCRLEASTDEPSQNHVLGTLITVISGESGVKLKKKKKKKKESYLM